MKNKILSYILFFAGFIAGATISLSYCHHTEKNSRALRSNDGYRETIRNIHYLKDVMLLGGAEMFDEIARIIPLGESMGVRDCLLMVREKNDRWTKFINKTDNLFKFDGNTNMADGFGVGMCIKFQSDNLFIWSYGENRRDNDTKFDDVGLLITKIDKSVVIRDLDN